MMRYKIFFFFIISLVGCTLDNKPDNSDENTCEDIELNSFNEFLSINRLTPENKLKQVFGKPTGGQFSKDKSVFIYQFEAIERVSIKVFTGAKSGKIETLTFEVLGLNNHLISDVKKAKSTYPLDACHASLFGKNPKQIIKLFGEAFEDKLVTDNVEANVRVLRYFVKDKEMVITFNFYPSQTYRLSLIIVDWY